MLNSVFVYEKRIAYCFSLKLDKTWTVLLHTSENSKFRELEVARASKWVRHILKKPEKFERGQKFC